MADSKRVPAHAPVDAENPMARMAPSYDAYMRRMTFGQENALREMTVDLAQIRPGDQVLEVGCGTGTLTLAAKRRVGGSGQVNGIDPLPQMIELSRRKAEQAGANVSFQPGSIDAIPFEAGRFDAVLCSFMIFHMPEPVMRRGIPEIYRVLKPGGRLLVLDLAVPRNPLQAAVARTLFSGMLSHEVSELVPVMQDAGFGHIEVAPAKFSVLFLPVLAYARGTKIA